MVRVHELSAGYSGRKVLEGLTFSLPPGSITAVIGPNGCGKSTLLRTLSGLHSKSGGDILLNGKPIDGYSRTELARTAAFLSQSHRVPELTALRLVLHGRFPYLSYPRRYRKEDTDIAMAAMERLGIADLAHRPMATLSGGTRQKVYIAMALAQDTPLVLLDEPTTYLDISHQLRLMDHAKLLAAEGKTVVLVLHDLAMALRTAHRLLVLSKGRLAAEGTPEEVFESGCLPAVFGVEVCRTDTADGFQYYYKYREG